jgi:predicted nucleotidyltransferase
MATESISQLLASLSSQGAAASHLPRLAALRVLCEESPECIAVALVGSFAQGRGDRISDLDLAAFVANDSEAEFMDRANEILARDELLNAYGEVRPGEVAFRKYVYLDFSSCEFHAFNMNTPFKLRPPYVAVWDPSDFLASLVVNEPPPRHETFEAFPHGTAGLIWELIDCVKWLQRGREQLAKDYLRKLVAAIDQSEQSGNANTAA